MIDVAIFSNNPYIQKSLRLLINTDPNFKLIKGNEEERLKQSKGMVVLIDIDIDKMEDLLRLYSGTNQVYLYTHSEEFLDIIPILQKYKVKFFNVYTKPDLILQLLKGN